MGLLSLAIDVFGNKSSLQATLQAEACYKLIGLVFVLKFTYIIAVVSFRILFCYWLGNNRVPKNWTET